MILYTTYFAQLRNLPENIIPISICSKAPDWYKGLQYKKLAPKYDFFMEWKKNHDNDYYIKCFNEQVLSNFIPSQVYEELCDIAQDFVESLPEEDIRKQLHKMGDPYYVALICYEKPEDFCHRHLVADWLTSGGFCCTEWQDSETIGHS